MVAEQAGLDGPAKGIQFRLTLAPGCGTFRKKSGCKKAEINIWPAGKFSIGRSGTAYGAGGDDVVMAGADVFDTTSGVPEVVLSVRELTRIRSNPAPGFSSGADSCTAVVFSLVNRQRLSAQSRVRGTSGCCGWSVQTACSTYAGGPGR